MGKPSNFKHFTYETLLARVRAEHIFILLGTLFGLIFVFFTPPYQVPDEPKHFFRAYQISEGRFRAERRGGVVGGFLPTPLVKTAPVVEPIATVRTDPHILRDKLSAAAAPAGSRSFTSFPNTAMYSPVPYLPQAVGILVGRLFGGNLWVQFYLGRLMNLFMWLCIAVASVRLLPIRRWAIVFLLLLPMSVFQAASLSADVFTNAIGWLAVALTLHTVLGERPLDRRRLIALIIVFTLLALTKPVYALSGLLLLAIPLRVIGSRKRWWRLLLLVGGAMAVAMVVWYAFGRSTFVPIQPDANPGRQLNLVIHQPGLFLEYFQRTIRQVSSDWVISAIGFFGWLRFGFPWWYYVGVLVGLSGVVFIDRQGADQLGWGQRSIILLTFVISALVIIGSQFIMWGTTDMLTIEGVQGRYFLPIIPLLVCWLPTGDRRPTKQWFFLVMSAVWFMVLVVAVVNAWIGFYPWSAT